jgi:hypothetical protein
MDDIDIITEADLIQAVNAARQRKQFRTTMEFATDDSYGIHPHHGVPQLYFDQINIIAKHLRDIQEEAITRQLTPSHTTPPTPEEPVSQSFKLHQLRKREDWPEWRKSRFKMLDQYHEQGMFGAPTPLPKHANVFRMLWTYLLKIDGTRKARMVCDGNPAMRRNLTIGHTYANSLDSASERLFWSLVAKEGLIAMGADVSNAFAEAPPPKEPLYMYIDDAFREWWVEHLGRPPIPPECNVIKVHNAIQGHPEAPRLWEKHIDRILREIGLTPTTHEPCLYSGTIGGNRIIFLRQVDDFAVAAHTQEAAAQLLTTINSKMRINLKALGIIDRFNGLDIKQSKHYVKITCDKYLYKMLKTHNWLDIAKGCTPSTPLPADVNYIISLEQAILPATEDEKDNLRQRMGWNYRQVIGELIYPAVKCRPDILYPITKLSQYMDNPAEAHYHALLHICKYISTTIDQGIYYWRTHPREDLPELPLPTCHHDNYTLTVTPADHPDHLYGYVDADWASDTRHRKSVTGIIIMYAGGAIGYRTKFQETIAHSSTEAEFTAACDAGKLILYYRSLLSDFGLEQPHATVLYEDNNGALLMANAQQPTKRTRHMDIKHFAILDWVEQDLMVLKRISTHDNAADHFTKALGKQLFSRHVDTIMGLRAPVSLSRSTILSYSACMLPPSGTPSGTPISAPLPKMGGVRDIPSMSTYISIG